VWFYRFFCVLGPFLTFWITYMIASDLKKKGGTHRAERTRLRRKPEGGYEEEPVA
jgi:hypothetical protein